MKEWFSELEPHREHWIRCVIADGLKAMGDGIAKELQEGEQREALKILAHALRDEAGEIEHMLAGGE